jgi:hypothetical protein
MEQGTWRWRREDGRLVLDGTLLGGRVVLRLAPVDGGALAAGP